MNRVLAMRIAAELKGEEVGGWTALDYINHGKSALVVKATKKGEVAALKIFDRDLVERFGLDIQLSRIEREKSLIGKSHPHLIEIKDGGACVKTDYLFVAMAYLPHKNLAQVLTHVPRDRIFSIISQVAQAAKFLEDTELVHRDIKPENIAISDDFGHATLMDLGVIRPLNLSELTDQEDEKSFVGTLQYSPPELLYREEDHSLTGWRAVTFYQLGAVLHDMIMRKPIFKGYRQPFARLVDAVRETRPEIHAEDIDSDLILLAQSSLVKEPDTRLSHVKWEHFLEPPLKKPSIEKVRERIRKRHAILRNHPPKDSGEIEKNRLYERYLKLQEIVSSVNGIIRSTCVNDRECFPPIEIVQRVEPKNSDASIITCFRPSLRHHLYANVNLFVSISLLDKLDEIVNLRFVALASDDCIKELDFDSFDAESLFAGPYEPKVVEAKVEILLWTLIDKGQELQISEADNKGEISSQSLQLKLDLASI